MKKLLIGILCLIAVATMTFGLVGCNKKNNTSESESTSVSESIVTSDSCAHTLDVLKKDAEEHWYECSCGEKSGNREAHGYDEGVVTKQPTEEEEGTKLFTCTTCGNTKTVSVPKKDHVHSLSKVDGTPATCEEDGVKDVWTCSGCKKSYLDAQATQEVVSQSSLVIPAINHANEVFSHRVEPRCGIPGADVYVCPDCSRPREEPIDALEHDWKNIEVVEATCQHGGYTLQKCSHCQNEQKVGETGITDCDEEYVVVLESNCDATGLAKYVCNDCKKEREIVLPKCEHEIEATTTVEPSCTEGGYTLYECSNCEYSYKDDLVDSLGGHDFVVDSLNSSEATCVENGITVYVCSRGCESARYSEEIDALGHDEVAPTCTQEGYCTRCDGVRVAKIPHELEVEEDVAATCLVDGHVTLGCTHCDYSETKVPQTHKATGHAEDSIKWTETEVSVYNTSCQYYVIKSGECPSCNTVVERVGEIYVSHSYVCEITTPATCIQEGVKTYTCACGDNYTENYDVDTSAHKLDAGVQEGNYLVYTCQNGECGHTERVLHIVEESVDANVVKEAEKLSVGEATLKLDEQTKGQLGENSSVSLSAGALDGADLDEAKGKLNEDQLELLGNSKIYNFEMEVDGSPVTKFDGFITIRIPYELDGQDPEDIVVWYIEDDTPVLIEAKYIEIDGEGFAEFATNHFSYYSVAKMTPAERCALYGCYTEGSVTVLPATCLEGGYTLTVCRRCGKKTYTDRVDALGHNWAEVESLHVETTCTVNGYEKHECTRCQVSYEVKTQAYGHEWVKNDQRTVVATCTQEGSVTYECERCDNEYSITEKKTAHKYNTNVVGATCTTAGYTECVCRDCGHTAKKNPTQALGHSIVDTVHKPTCIDKGYTSHECSRCDEKFANTDYTDKVDHEWDKDAPTCEEDKLCKHCKKRDENNGKAHGHYMEDGKCKHCSKPCEHTFKYSHTVESTCSGAGYEVWVCKHCQASEFRGETGVASHDFALLKEVEPTCQTEGYKVEVCRACGYTQTTQTKPVVDHKYTNGKCVYCGLVHQVEDGYIDVLATIKNVNGIVVEIDTLDFEVIDDGEVEGRTTALKAIQLMLYVGDDGKLQGAGTGAIQIFNGPVAGGYASYAFKALIENDNLYVLVEVEDGNVYEMAIKYAIQALTDSIVDEAFGSKEDLDVILESGLLETVESIASANNEKISSIVSEIVQVLFTTEKVDGIPTYTLDFDKARQLNDDLAHLSAEDALEKYFGEELLPSLKRLARELVFLELNDLPEYLVEKGLPADEIFNVINFIAKSQGAPEDYDIKAMLESPDMAGYTVGDAVLGEDFSFDDVMNMVEEMQGYPVYLILMGEQDETMVEEVYQMVNQTIDMFAGVNVSFTTDANGVIDKFNLSATDFVFDIVAGNKVKVSIDLSILINGAIDVTWEGIGEDIDKDIVLPDGLQDQAQINNEYNIGSESGKIEIDGKYYEYNAMYIAQERNVYKYSEVAGVITKADCGDWIEYAVMVPCYRYQTVQIGSLVVHTENGTETYFVKYGNVDQRVKLTINEQTGEVSFVAVNGETVTVNAMNTNVDYFEIYELAFGETDFDYMYYSLSNETVYYNKVTGEYDGETHHNFVLNEENSYEPAGCGEQGLRYYECSECGEIFKDYYYKYHNTKSKTCLSQGSVTCDDGVDMYYECIDCGEITDYYENWSTGCHYVSEKEFKDGVAVEKGTCTACGDVYANVSFTVVSDFALELYTGKWGTSAPSKPNTGIGGGSIGVDKEENRDGFTFKFVPTEDVTVEFYSKHVGGEEWYGADFYGAIYGSDFSLIENEGGNIGNGHFGITYTFSAGETYYLIVRNYERRIGVEYFVCFTEKESESVSLADYGCGCGGEIVISSYYGRKEYTVNNSCGVADNETCSTCGFRYYSTLNYTINDNCEEVEQGILYFNNEKTGESFEFVVFEFKTGITNHNTYGHSDSESYETTDENGNTIIVERYVRENVCERCGEVTHREEREDRLDLNGNLIVRIESYYEWSTALGECELRDKTETKYVIYLINGIQTSRISSRKWISYENGEVDNWELTEYIYYAESPCKITRKYSSSYGKGYENTNYEHSHSYKELPDESFVEEVILDGALVTKITVASETYCARCFASIYKDVTVRYVDENGNEVKTEEYHYVPYAESQDVYGWEIERALVYTRGFVKYSYKWFSYQTSREETYYVKNSNGEEINSYVKTVYEYVDPTSSCEYTAYSYDQFGNLLEDHYTERYDDHIAGDWVKLLGEGSTSCNDGCYEYYVCYICGYKEEHGYWGSGHHNYIEDAHLDNVEVYDLREYGQVCGSTLLVVNCPCGEDKTVYFLNDDPGCDFYHEGNYIYDDENKVDHWYEEYHCAVSDPQCGFAFSYERWRSRTASCEETYNEKWVFGLDSANPLVIEVSYLTGGYLHNYESHSYNEEVYHQDGYIVYYNSYDDICSNCSHVGRKFEQWSYRIENADNVEEEVKEEHLNTYYQDFGDRILSSIDYVLSGKISHPTEDRTHWGRFIERNTYYDKEGNESYWHQNEYDYNSCIHTPIRTHTNSYGEHDTYQEEHDYWDYDFNGYVVTPTCTQDGIEHRVCSWCKATRDHECSNFGHNYDYVWDEEFGEYVYVCNRCDLVNFTGYDGNVIMEDMTDASQGVFTVGYHFYEHFDYVLAVSLIVEGEEEPIVLPVDVYDDGKSILTVDFNVIREACQELGLTFEEVMVKVTILPTNGDYTFDYSVTMDSHQGV